MKDFGFYLVITNPVVGYARRAEAADKFGKRLNFFITSDYYIGCMQAGVTGLQYNQTGNNPWVNWCSGVAIVVHPDNTYDAFAVKCSKK